VSANAQNVQEAEDLTQETFLQIHRKLHLYRGEAALSTWIHRVTVNQVLMYLRKVKKRRACETAIEVVPMASISNGLRMCRRTRFRRM
jgi:RNA polymerase sigma factor (sigma-70 family)